MSCSVVFCFDVVVDDEFVRRMLAVPPRKSEKPNSKKHTNNAFLQATELSKSKLKIGNPNKQYRKVSQETKDKNDFCIFLLNCGECFYMYVLLVDN
jgi:hypothetical protein